MRLALLTAALGLLALPAYAEVPAYHLQLSAIQHIESMLDASTPLKSGLSLQADVQKAKINIRGSAGGKTKLSLSLVHSSLAEEGATVVAGAALKFGPEGAEAKDVAEIVARLEASGRTLGWDSSSPEPSPGKPKQEDAPPKRSNLTWLAVAGFALILGAAWHHRRRKKD